MNYNELEKMIKDDNINLKVIDEIIKIEDEEIRGKLAEQLNSQIYIEMIAKTIKDLNIRVKLIDNKLFSIFSKMEAVEDIEDTATKLKIIDLTNDMRFAEKMANTIEEETIAKEIQEKLQDKRLIEQIRRIEEQEKEQKNGFEAIEEMARKKVEYIKAINSDEIKVDELKKIKSSKDKLDIIITIKNEELRAKMAYLHFKDDSGRVDIIKTIKNNELIERIIKKQESDIWKAAKIAQAKGKREWFNYLNEVQDNINDAIGTKRIIDMYNDTEFFCVKKQIAWKTHQLDYNSFKQILLQNIGEFVDEFDCNTLLGMINEVAINDNDGFIETIFANEKMMNKIIATGQSCYDMQNIISKMNGNTKFMFLEKIISQRGNLNIMKSYLGIMPYETIISEINKIMELSGVESEKIEQKKLVLMKMYKTNNDVVKTIDYKLLDNKYIDKLGVDRINLISCYPGTQTKILGLSDKKLDILVKCIDQYTRDSKAEDWTTIASDILDKLSNKEYDELINNIKNITKIDINKLSSILQNSNVFNIKTEDDIQNYEIIKRKKTDELIKSEDINDKLTAVFEKAFGIDISYVRDILYSYGDSIESLPDSDIKNFMKCLKEINNCKSCMTLNEIYNQCKEVTFLNKADTERKLKTEYGKLYNEGLLKVSDLEELEENMYSAGTDFKMIITSLEACYRYSNYTENYKDDWNRPFLESQTVSMSYIRNDMLGTAGRPKLCYGFDEMSPNALMQSGNEDIGSATSAFKNGSSSLKFYEPNTMINKTSNGYNELDYLRIQNGEKKKPSYIVVFKIDGKIENLENAKKAQKDWGGLPIVVIDVNECLKAEEQKVRAMLSEYETNPSSELANEIYNKIKNNRKFRCNKGAVVGAFFCQDVGLVKLKSNINREKEPINNSKNVKEEELEEIYKQTTAEERREEISKMQKFFQKIHEITEEVR